MAGRLFTIYQVADLLGSTAPEVTGWIQKGLMPSREIDGQRRISETDLVYFLKSQGIDIEQVLTDTVLAAIGLDRKAAPPAGAKPSPASPSSAPPRKSAPESVASQHDSDREDSGKTRKTSGEADRRPGAQASEHSDRHSSDEHGHGHRHRKSAPHETAAGHEAAPARAATPPQRESPAASAAQPPSPAVVMPPVSPAPAPTVWNVTPAQPVTPGESVAEEDVEVPADSSAQVAEAILQDAVARRAEAVHLEPHGDSLALRMRQDGVLQEKVNFRLRLPPQAARGLAAHFLKRAGLPATEAAGTSAARTPPSIQEGEFTARVDGRDVAFHLHACQAEQGLRLVIRPREAAPALALSALGLSADQEAALRRAARASSGLFLLAAPPKSGGSTTLAALAAEAVAGAGAVQRSVFWIGRHEPSWLRRRASSSAVAIAAEDASAEASVGGDSGAVSGTASGAAIRDPVRFAWDAAGVRPREAIRAARAQDADVIVAADVREAPDLLAAFEAAAAGALVLARVWADSAPAAVEMLGECGVGPWQTAAIVLAAASQRLLRRLCPDCRKEAPAIAGAIAARHLAALECLRLRPGEIAFPTFEAGSCKRCFGTGFSGRMGVFSVLEAGELPRRDASPVSGGSAAAPAPEQLDAACCALRDAALELLRRGETSLEELARSL